MYKDGDHNAALSKSSKVSGSESDLKPKAKISLIFSTLIFSTCIPKKQLKLSNPGHNVTELGDHVIFTVRYIDHPLFEEVIINQAFVLFGIVKVFSFVSWSNKKLGATINEKLIVAWMMIEHELHRLCRHKKYIHIVFLW